LSRMYLYGRIAQGFGRDVLGVDLSRATGLTSAFNLDLDEEHFGMMPIPPIAGVAADIVRATTTRDIKRLRPMTFPGIGDLPIPKQLFPGGVGMSRAMRALNQWAPDGGGFTDDEGRMMYTGGTGDLLLSMLGVPLNKSRRAREAMERVSTSRDKVRKFRRKMAQAIAIGDVGAQRKLQAQWSNNMKGWPPLNVTAQDVQRYRDNARIPALQRMINGLGSMRPMFEESLMEYDEDLLVPQYSVPMPGEQ